MDPRASDCEVDPVEAGHGSVGRTVAAWLVASAAVLSSCAGLPGGTEGDLSRAAAQSASATASAELAMELVAEHRTTRAHAVTVLSDALDEVLAAYSAVAAVEVATGQEAAHRAALLDRIDAAATVLGEARARTDAVATAPSAADVTGRLADLTGYLSAFAEGSR
ncbi:hypothetical protein G352_17039 [Rhodococcus ruber BKS 20-38]|uniref:Uncharacterized protein n=1 Tax=Rhodococcus ruber BKS 20-38 TaxID=1278076 RepID=M2YKF9_9NOCA|nr:hypothetical protein [Rhodococcus ruber]EME62280.1 hypothetical protein G352_17039 [Rhodococcus ruber BKS 20-38]